MSVPAPPAARRRAGRRWPLLVAGGLVVAAVVGFTLYTLSALEPRVNGRSAGQLRAALSGPDADARRQAAIDLGRLNSSGSVALPELATALTSDPDPGVRAAAAEAVGKMAPASERVVDSLASALTDRDPWVRMNAALALLLLREKARPAIPALIAATSDVENDTTLNAFHHTIRQAVLTALGEAAADTPDAVPTLVAVLD